MPEKELFGLSNIVYILILVQHAKQLETLLEKKEPMFIANVNVSNIMPIVQWTVANVTKKTTTLNYLFQTY